VTDIHIIPDTSDREVDWTLDPEAGRELERAARDAGRAPLRDVRHRFGRNVSFTIIARVVNMARGVCIVPFLLAHIGLEAYGIWTTIFILVSYVGVTTLGLSNVYIKYVAEFHARKEYEKANSLFSTGLAVTVPLCGSIFMGFVLLWGWYSPWLHLPASHAADGKEAVLIVLGIFLLSISFNAFGDILYGAQEIASTQIFMILSILVECVLIIWLVLIGRGIRGLAEAYLVRVVINDGLTIWWCKRKLKWLHFSLRLVRRESLRYVIHFGGVVQIQSMISIFLASVERFVALVLINASAAGLLDVAKKWPTSFSSVPTAYFAALLPAASHVDAASEKTDRMRNLRELYLSVSRYANLCSAFFLALFACWARPLLHVWLGPELPMREAVVPLFVVFSLAMHFHMLTGPGTSVFRGMGRVYEEFTYTIPNLLLLAITLPVAHWIDGSWTPLGICVAVSVATAVSACVLMGRVQVVLKLPIAQFISAVILPGLAPYLVAFALVWPLTRMVEAVNRWQGAGVVLVVGIVYAALVGAILHRWVFTGAEKQKGQGMVRRGLGMLRGREATA